jgi:hypothetical protein
MGKLTDLLLELLASLDDLLHDCAVAVVLLFDDAVLGLFPVVSQLADDLGLDVVHTQFNVLL